MPQIQEITPLSHDLIEIRLTISPDFEYVLEALANRTLKEQGHLWNSHHNVLTIVRESGLLNGTNYYKKIVRKEKN